MTKKILAFGDSNTFGTPPMLLRDKIVLDTKKISVGQ